MISAETVFLVVDDADTMRKVNSSQLERLGARRILLASNGAEALAMLHARRVNVILSDWNMPVKDGMALLREVRRDPQLAQLPFIMITAECSRAQITEAIAAGVSSILIKPYTAQELAHHLARAMTHRSGPAAAPEPSNPAKRKPDRRPTLLVVDDMPDNLSLIAGLFIQDYRVRVAQDGLSALAICTSNAPPDLILLDVMMPGMDGFELAQRLRSHPTASRIPLIFITAMNDPDARQRALELGAVEFVSKPIDAPALRLQVINLLQHVEQHKALQQEYANVLELERLREEATSISRHDLKAPLCNMLGMLRGLGGGDNLLPGQRQMLQVLQGDCQHLLDMLDLAGELYRIETGRFELRPEPVDLQALLRRLIEAARLTYRIKGLTIELRVAAELEDAPAMISGRALLCFSLLNNLLKNACEAAPDHSRVRISLSQGESMQLRMENSPAVPTAFRPHFFEKYASHDKVGGSGLGTYSARLLAEAQHGSLRLEVDDEADLTCLQLELPRAAASVPQACPA